MATLLCRQSGAKLVGASFDQGHGCVVVTVQGDGAAAYDLEQRRLGSYPLGARASLAFQTASVQHTVQGATGGTGAGIIAHVVHDRASGAYSLHHQEVSTSPRAIAEAAPRVAVPGAARSVHLLHRRHAAAAAATTAEQQQQQQQQQLLTCVVLNDGRVGTTPPATDGASTSAPPQLTLLPAPPGGAPRSVLAASSGDTLIVLTQTAPGSAATLRVLQLSGAAGGLQQAKTAQVACPGASASAAHATPTAVTLSAAFALVQWSNGHATAVHGLQGGPAVPLRPVSFPLADAVGANGASSSAPAATAATAAGRKRKSAAAATADHAAAAVAPGARARVLCAAVDDRQFVVLDLDSSAAQSRVCYSLHDAEFGCPLSSGSVDVDAPLLSLDASQCAVVAAGPEATIVALGGAVHVLPVRSEPVSLLSLVARLSVAAAPSAAAAAASGVPPAAAAQGKAAGGGRAVAAALIALPPPVSLDPLLLAGGGGGGAAASVTGTMELQPVPAAAVSRPDDMCASLIEQLAAPPQPPQPALLESAVSYITGRRQHAMPVPPQLLSCTARGAVAGKQWATLGRLLALVPPGGLSGCGDVLVAAAAAQQYGLIARLATCLDELSPRALVAALQLLLAPTTKANLAARQAHYAMLRASAEARVAEAEAALAAAAAAAGGPEGGGGAGAPPRTRGGGRGARGGHSRQQQQQPAQQPQDAATALALAQCAAAAVDGFGLREVLLHPLLAMPVDAPAVTVALRGLGAGGVDALLSYVAKWAAKYAGGAIGEAAAGVVLPQELLFPYYHQVLEWGRMTLDAHLPRLLLSRRPLPALEALQQSLGGAVEGGKRLVALRGALEHMAAGAPLPAAHAAAAAQYTVEVLDLRAR